MGFTTPCFIRKNTANIRNRLKELGYYVLIYLELLRFIHVAMMI